MKNKIIRLLSLALAGLFLNGCASTNALTQLDKVSPDQAILVAKFRIIYNGDDVTTGCGVFLEPLPAFAGRAYPIDESGYLYLTRPVGLNSIKILIHKSGLMQHRFYSDELTCQLAGGGVVNYIGDINIYWNGMGKGSAIGLTALTGILGNNILTGGGVSAKVEDNTAAAQAAFQQKFSTTQTITPSLLVVKPHQ